MKKIVFLVIITLITVFFTSIYNFTYAMPLPTPIPQYTAKQSISASLGDLDDYKGENTDSDKLKSIVGNLLGGIRAVGTVVSVVMLILIGIRYLFASVEERADYKKSLIPYLIGAGILFTGTTMPQLIYNLINEL